MLTYEQKLDAVLTYLRSHDAQLDEYLTDLEQTQKPLIPTDIEFAIRGVLVKFNVSPSRIGFRTLTEALKLINSDNTYLKGVSVRLYPKVSEITGLSIKSVESSIRNATSGISSAKEALAKLALEVDEVIKKGGVNNEA